MFPEFYPEYKSDYIWSSTGLDWGTDWIKFNDLLGGLGDHDAVGPSMSLLVRRLDFGEVQGLIHQEYKIL